MTDTIAELRGLLGKATAGPWRVWTGGGSIRAPYNRTSENGAEQVEFTRVAFGHDGAAIARDADYTLITATINALPALLDELERKTKALEAIATGDDFISKFGKASEIARLALKGTPND